PECGTNFEKRLFCEIRPLSLENHRIIFFNFCSVSLIPKMQPAEQLVRDCACLFGHLLCPQSLVPVGSQEGNDIAGTGLRNAGDIDDELVHADISDDMGSAAPHQHRQLCAGQAAWQAVGVADGDGGGPHGNLCPEMASVADSFSGM